MNAVRFEVEALRDLARRCRELAARMRVSRRKSQFLELAEGYESRAAELEKRGELPNTPVC